METKALNSCVVCKETSEQVALHYAKMLCNGCRAFFKRTVQGKVKIFECKSQGQCVVDPSTRKLCKACRFDACKRAGVDSAKVQQPKDDNAEAKALDLQLEYAANVNNRLMPSASRGIQSAFQQYYFANSASLASHNICSTPSAINVHSPSFGVGLYNQNHINHFGSHQGVNPHAFTSSQLPVHSSRSTAAAASSSMPFWPPALGGGYLPAGYSSMELNNRLAASSSSINVTHGGSSDIATSSKLAYYADMANYLSSMGSNLFYNPNAASASQHGALSYVDLFQQSASAIANYASVSGARSLASAYIDRYGLNGQDLNNVPVPVYDSTHAAHTGSYSVCNTRQSTINSLMSTVPFSAQAESEDSKYDIVGIYQRNRCNSQNSRMDVKKELDYLYHNTNDLTDNEQDSSDSLDETQHGHQLRIERDLQRSSLQNESQQPSLVANYLLAGPSRGSEEVPCTQQSGKSSAFMIDMLLKPQQQYMWSKDVVPGLMEKGSAPDYKESIPSLEDTLEYVDVYNTTEDIERDELKSQRVNTPETLYNGNLNTDSAKDASEVKKSAKNMCSSESQLTAKITMSQQTTSSLLSNQSHCVSGGDSGLGRSNQASSSDLQHNRPTSVDHMKASGSEMRHVHFVNKENLQATPPRSKRRLSLSEESNVGPTKKIKPDNSSLASTSCNRNYLCEIYQNFTSNTKNHENSPRKLVAQLATGSDSSSEEEAATRNTRLRPKYTSTPIVLAQVDNSKSFLEIICAFAKYFQADNKTTPDEDSDTCAKHSPCSSSSLKKPSFLEDVGEDSFHQQDCSESQTHKWERLDTFQAILMRKVQSSDTYTMTEFKADALKLDFLAQDAVRCGQLKF